MTNTTFALLVKAVLTFLPAWVIFGILDGNPISYILLIALLGTGLNYLLGDLFILPKMGNVTASISDGILAVLTTFVVDLLTPQFNTSYGSLLIFAIAIAIVEFFFHKYLLRNEKVAP